MRVVCPTIKVHVANPTSNETLVKVDISVDLQSSGNKYMIEFYSYFKFNVHYDRDRLWSLFEKANTC